MAINGFFQVLLVGLLSISLQGCASLVRPNFKQEITELRAGQYSLDTEHAYVHFDVGHLGLSRIVGRFNSMGAALDFDPENLSATRLSGFIETDSIDVNNADLQDQLKGESWLAADQYPQAVFDTTRVVSTGGNNMDIIGELQLKGTIREVVLKATFNGGADVLLTGKYTLGFSASTVISRSEFGIDAFQALVSDDINITIHAEFQRN